MKKIIHEYTMRIGNEVGWMTQLVELGNKSMLKTAVPKYSNQMAFIK